MKKYFLLLILLILPYKISAQFSIDKFINEKVEQLEPKTEINLDEIMKTAVVAKYESLDIKVAYHKSKSGKLVIKSIAKKNLKDPEAKKLYDKLLIKMKALLGKTSKENVINGVKNNLWLKKDGTRYMLTYSGNLAMLVIMKK